MHLGLKWKSRLADVDYIVPPPKARRRCHVKAPRRYRPAWCCLRHLREASTDYKRPLRPLAEALNHSGMDGYDADVSVVAKEAARKGRRENAPTVAPIEVGGGGLGVERGGLLQQCRRPFSLAHATNSPRTTTGTSGSVRQSNNPSPLRNTNGLHYPSAQNPLDPTIGRIVSLILASATHMLLSTELRDCPISEQGCGFATSSSSTAPRLSPCSRRPNTTHGHHSRPCAQTCRPRRPACRISSAAG